MYKLSNKKDDMKCKRKCCPSPLPHYNLTITDQDFVERNIELSAMNRPDTDIKADALSTLPAYRYQGDLAKDELRALPAHEYDAYIEEAGTARRCRKWWWWRDLNKGRWYQRGLNDTLDETINERNNRPAGWYNAYAGYAPYSGDPTDAGRSVCMTGPGQQPYAQPYLENGIPPVNPESYIYPLTNMATYSNKHYFYSIYDLDKYPQSFCRPKVPVEHRPPKCYTDYPERYD